MGAHMHFNSYFPGYYTTRSLDANGKTWALSHGDKISESGNFYNAFFSPDYVLAYKELLKQTMLKHETIFKDQIQELHRLYRRQRELMDEIKRNEFDKHYLGSNASHSNMVFMEIASDYVQKNFQVSGFPLINLQSSQMAVSGPEDILSPLSLVQGTKAQVCPPYPVKSEACSKDVKLFESKCKKVGKKILGLQLPADEYIDCEDNHVDEKVSEGPEALSYSVNRSPQVVYTSDVKSFFGSNILSSVFNGAIETPALVLESQKRVPDQNIPCKLEEQATCLSNGFMGLNSHSKLLCHELSGKTSSGFQSSLEESIQNTQKRPDLEVLANFLPSETGRKQEQLSSHDETGKFGCNLNGFLQSPNTDNLPSASKMVSEDHEQVFRPPTSEQVNQSLSMGRTIYGLERSRGNSDTLNNSLSGRHGAFCGHIFDDQSPQSNQKNLKSILIFRQPCDSGWNPIAVQALPCFNTSVPLGKRYKPLVGRPGLVGDSNLVPDNSGLEEHKSSIIFPHSADVNLNSKPPRFSSMLGASEGIPTTHQVEKHDYLASGISWLRPKPVRNGKDYIGHVNLTGVESLSLEAYSAGIHEVEPKEAEAAGSSSKMTAGSNDYNKSIISAHHFASSSDPSKTCPKPFKDAKSKGKCTVLDLNMACDSIPDLEIELTLDEHVENRVHRKDVGFGCLIDLNSSTNEAEFSQKPSIPAEIDVDAPTSPENKERSPPRGESDENQVETPLLLLGQEEVDTQNEPARIAAEALVTISSSSSKTALCKTISTDVCTSLHDTLQWFAGIVSSVVSDSANEFGLHLSDKNNSSNCEELLPNGVDYFEAMTLNLAEAKLEEICYRSNSSKVEETATSSSPSQQRKGRAPRGRWQQKDFQREILPSLASLSRYEVTEDLQTIGGLMEAAGAHWESGSTRYAARNRCSRGRKRSLVSGSNAVVGLGCSALSLLKQLSSSSNGTMGKEGRSVICWGKVTRRRRGQRYPVRLRNQQLILSQV